MYIIQLSIIFNMRILIGNCERKNIIIPRIIYDKHILIDNSERK